MMSACKMLTNVSERQWPRRAAAIAALAALSAMPALAQAPAQSRSQVYATLGEWTVEFVPADRQRIIPAHCHVTKIYGQENALRFASGSKLYAIDFMGAASQAQGNARSYDVEYWYDQQTPNTTLRGVAKLIQDNGGLDWARIEEPTDDPGSVDQAMNTKTLTIKAAAGNDQWQYALDGSRQALDALFACRDEKVLGQPPRRRAPAPVAQMPPPQFQGQFQPPPMAQFAQPPQFQAAPPPPPRGGSLVDYCNGYANEMVSNTTRALQIRCAGWPAGHMNRDGHVRWCMGKPQGDVEKARNSWSGRLQGCIASGGGRPAPTPVAVTGNASRHPVCSSFAQHAERWDNAAKGQGCRISNDKNEREYYNWCLGTTDADFRKRSATAAGHKGGREKECTAQLRRQVRL